MPACVWVGGPRDGHIFRVDRLPVRTIYTVDGRVVMAGDDVPVDMVDTLVTSDAIGHNHEGLMRVGWGLYRWKGHTE